MEKIDFWSDDSGESTVFRDKYTQHSVWDMVDVSVNSINNADRYFASNPYSFTCEDLSFDITFVRRPLYFMMNNVFPCLILNFVVILLFTLPFNMQVGACKTLNL